MSLRYDLTKIEDYKSRCYCVAYDENGDPIKDGRGEVVFKIDPLTEHIIFMTMNVGIGEINKRTAQDFYNRALFYERVFDSPRRVDGERRFISAAEVKKHIGLSTNASRMSKKEFINHVWECYEHERPVVLEALLPKAI